MKAKELLERKAKLNEELVLVAQQIIKLGKAIEQKGLDHFISSGELDKPFSLPLDKAKQRLEYLRNMTSQLNRAIRTAREAERKVQIAQAQKKLDANLAEHDRLNKQGSDLKKTLHELGHKGLALNEEELGLRQELKSVTRSDYTAIIKLTKEKDEVDEFLKKHYVADVSGLRSLMEETRTANKSLLTPSGIRPIGLKRQDVYLGFELTLGKDSGQILKRKPITRTVEALTGNKAQAMEII